ncbi:MAG: type II toxin-antitoxin system Phd/YefM family antitoxin, partial [Candidatus Saccharimonadales bacterium]
DHRLATVSIQDAATRLAEFIHGLKPGDELIITEKNQPVAKLVGHAAAPRHARKPGSAKGKLIIHAEDDDHLLDFREYMP